VDDRPRVEQLDGHLELIVHGGAEREGLARSNTYFDVVFAAREPPNEPFWPIRFTVGFH
jgi:hypothetical protein